MTKPTKTLRDRRRLNRGDMAELLGVSLTKLDAMVRQGCPIAQRPGRGKASVFNTLDVLQWYFAPRAASVEDPEALEPAERKNWYQGEHTRRMLQTMDAGLVPAHEVQAAVVTAHAAIAAALLAIPGDLQRRAGLTDEQAHEARHTVTEALADFGDRLTPYASGVGE